MKKTKSTAGKVVSVLDGFDPTDYILVYDARYKYYMYKVWENTEWSKELYAKDKVTAEKVIKQLLDK